MIRSFPPLATPQARILILGSMPGVASLEAGQYYAHKRNLFWPIMGALIGAGPDQPYERRVEALLNHRIALWDVLQSCQRAGSLDSAIRDEVPNDLGGFLRDHSQITHIYMNGAKAAQAYKKYIHNARAGLIITRLPSTSPAHAALSFEAKLAVWRQILDVY